MFTFGWLDLEWNVRRRNAKSFIYSMFRQALPSGEVVWDEYILWEILKNIVKIENC